MTLRFEHPKAARPGQFVMVWIPGEDELPMSLSYVREGEPKGVTIKAMGETTRRLLSMRPGAPIGIRGPYGVPFDLSPRRILVVAGGSGAAILAPAAEYAQGSGAEVTVANGATTARELLFPRRLQEAATGGYHEATDDGTQGRRGFVTDLAADLLQAGRFDALWTCGPEIMMEKLYREALRRGVPFFASLERHMKCAIAMCDACAFGPYHVCSDGPVFSGEQIARVEDFGRFKRAPSGARVRP